MLFAQGLLLQRFGLIVKFMLFSLNEQYWVKPGNDECGCGQPVAPIKKRGKDQPVSISIPIPIWMML